MNSSTAARAPGGHDMNAELVIWFGSIDRSHRKVLERILRTLSSLSASMAPPPARGQAARRVLFLGWDVERVRETMVTLRACGFEPVIASDMESGVDAGELASMALVVLSTDEVARAEAVLRELRAAEPRPIPIVVSSSAPVSCDPRLLCAGADVVIAADAAPDELVRAAVDAIQRASPPVLSTIASTLPSTAVDPRPARESA